MAGCGACEATRGAAPDGRFRRVLWIALVVNLTMFAVEIAGSWLSGSMALQADALDFLGDSFNYAISLLVLGMAIGARAGAALLKGASMAAFGVWVLGAAAYRVLAGAPPDAAMMGAIGLLALGANVAVAVMLYRYRAGDSNMRSVWLCSRNDAFANVAVVLAAGGVHVTGAHWPDLLVAVLIAGLCLTSAISVTRQALAELGSLRDGEPAAARAEFTAGD